MNFKKITKNKKAFSLIEVLIVTFIMAVVFTSFYSVSTVGTKYIIESKNKLAAVSFANEKMEIVRNLPYDKVGTVESIDVPGNISQEQDVVANGRSYKVLTSVRYIDDPLDGVLPADLIPNDYKVVDIAVTWKDSNGQEQRVSSTSRFVPTGLETSAGGSPLSINVADDATLLPIPQASVHITNSTLTPVINDTVQTDNDGHIMFPAARISIDDHLSIAKTGYETLTTMDSVAGTFTPISGHLTVAASFLNTYNYFLNKLADLTVKSADYKNNPVGSIEFTIEGGKIIGHDGSGNVVLSMLNTTAITDVATGERVYSDINSGNYTILMSPNVQYEFIDYDSSIAPATAPAILPGGSDMTYVMRVADKNVDALFLEIKNTDTVPVPVAGAKVTLIDGGTDVFTEKLSSLRGVVFYPDGATPLVNKTYTLKVEADGYDINTRSITIDKLTHVAVDLVRN